MDGLTPALPSACQDKENTGCISAAEIRHLLAGANIPNCDEDQCDELIKDFDKKGDGQIPYQDLAKAMFP